MNKPSDAKTPPIDWEEIERLTTTKPKRKPYTGVLAEPLEPHVPSADPFVDPFKAERAARVARDKRNKTLAGRMLALLDHYGIDRRDPLAPWRLSLALASAHVPGFREAKGKRGHPETLEYAKGWQLYRDVMAVVIERKCSQREACHILIVRGGGPYKGAKLPNLYKRFQRAKEKHPEARVIERLHAEGRSIEALLSD